MKHKHAHTLIYTHTHTKANTVDRSEYNSARFTNCPDHTAFLVSVVPISSAKRGGEVDLSFAVPHHAEKVPSTLRAPTSGLPFLP